MNIQQIKTFITVIESGSFSQAARILGVSQPAVTMQVQNLESDIGTSLLDRRYRRVELTEAGKVLVPYAREMIKEANRARADIAGLSGEVTGVLNIALSTTPGDYIIPSLLGDFLKEYPQVEVRLSVLNTDETLEQIEKREADVGMIGALAKSTLVNFKKMGTDELIVVASPKKAQELKAHATKGVCTLKELARERWVARSEDSGTQQVSKQLFVSQKINYDELDVAIRLGTGEAVVNAVEGGLGIAIVSSYVAAKSIKLGTLAEVPCEGFPHERPFYLVTPKRTLTRAAEAFISFVSAKL